MGLEWSPPLYPPSIKHLIDLPVDAERYKGKKILSIHGGADRLVPLKEGQKDLDDIKAVLGDDLEVVVVEGMGHMVSPEIVKLTGEWVWSHALTAD